MKVKCVECGYQKESKYSFDVCPKCRGTMTRSGNEMPSLLNAIEGKDKKLIKEIEKKALKGEIIRLM